MKPAVEGVSFIETENIPPELDPVNSGERKLLAFFISYSCNNLSLSYEIHFQLFVACPIIKGTKLMISTVTHPVMLGALTRNTSLTIGT